MSGQGEWQDGRARAIIARHQGSEGPLLPMLHDLQAEFGHVPGEAVSLLAEVLNISRADVHGVISFYHDFREQPPGRHVLQLCRAEACQSVGGDGLAARARARLGVEWGQTSADGAVSLEPIFCLGLCACAPAAMLDGQVVGRLDEASLDGLIAQARAR